MSGPAPGGGAVKLSIVTPLYNAERTLSGAVDSFLRLSRLEGVAATLYLVDDCSSDGTPALARSLSAAHGNIVLLSTEKNSGPGAARNAALDRIREGYIGFLDADDELEPEPYRDSLLEGAARGADWITCNGYMDDAGARKEKYDFDRIMDDTEALVRRCLRTELDGSVIFTIYSADLIHREGLRFPDGFYEDIPFAYGAMIAARKRLISSRHAYIKRVRNDSIVHTISERHIDGLLNACVQVRRRFLQAGLSRYDGFAADFAYGAYGTLAHAARDILRSGFPEPRKLELLRYLSDRTAAFEELRGLPPRSETKKDLLAARFIETFGDPARSAAESLRELAALESRLFGTSPRRRRKSCIYLQRAVYLAPNEIRACCQRFFFKNRMKGDVALISLDKPRDVDFEEVLAAKEDLIAKINDGSDDRCDGCPELKVADWAPVREETIDVVSIENHSVCNMRCSYCSDTYYGGLRPQYDPERLLSGMPVGKDLHIAWGGGEPVVGRGFEALFDSVARDLKPRTQRVFTNSLMHSKSLQTALDERRTSITTSVDAGTEETFRAVRGVAGLERVLANLRRYSERCPDLVTVKYIITGRNKELPELDAFTGRIAALGLTRCNFLISTDFKNENLPDDWVAAILILYFLLSRAGAAIVTFDDHVSKRVLKMDPRDLRGAVGNSFPEEYERIFGDMEQAVRYHAERDVIVWGTGAFADLLFRSSRGLRGMKIIGVVDGNPHRWGEWYRGHQVRSPDMVLESDASVVIASANFYGEIANKLISMGVEPKRIAPTFLL